MFLYANLNSTFHKPYSIIDISIVQGKTILNNPNDIIIIIYTLLWIYNCAAEPGNISVLFILSVVWLFDGVTIFRFVSVCSVITVSHAT